MRVTLGEEKVELTLHNTDIGKSQVRDILELHAVD